MARYRGTVTSERSQAQTFSYMANFANVSDWDPTVVHAEQLTAGEPGLGTRFDVRVRLMGRESAFTYEITEFQPPDRLVLRAENETTISLDTVEVRPRGELSELTYDAKLDLKSSAARLLDPLLGVLFQRLGNNAAAGLRRELAKS